MKIKDEITNFPTMGDTKKVSLRNSQYPIFPLEYAKNLRKNHPDIWKLGGNIEGNAQYRRLTSIIENGGKVETRTQEMAVRKREAWAARHKKNYRIAGTIAQIKWLVIGKRGLSYMKKLIREEIKKREKDNKMLIIKNLVCERIKTVGETTYSFVASNNKIDRMGDVINQSGWSLNAYKNNPVILFNHDSRALPIGKGSVEIIDGQLMIDIEFDEKDELAKKIKSKVEGGFLNAVSVGFKPIQAVERNTLDKENRYYGEHGTYFEKAELLEVSIVTIPANSGATAAKFIDSVDDLDIFARMVSKHIINIIEEDDEYKITFAKAKKPEQDVEPSEEHEEQPVEQVYNDDEDDKEKQYNLELIRALLA